MCCTHTSLSLKCVSDIVYILFSSDGINGSRIEKVYVLWSTWTRGTSTLIHLRLQSNWKYSNIDRVDHLCLDEASIGPPVAFKAWMCATLIPRAFPERTPVIASHCHGAFLPYDGPVAIPVGAVRVVHPGKHLRPVERVFHILVRSDVGPSVRIVSVDCHLAPCYRSAFKNKEGWHDHQIWWPVQNSVMVSTLMLQFS